MKHGSLFSGIGGFDLAAEWAGWENMFHCEWNPFGQKVLKHYWPNAATYEDITKTDFTIWRGKIDILTGGFPCQPYSLAGKRLGKEDERHLWPEMLRTIREVQPRWVVGENVLGLVNWNGGLVFEEVQADLEAEGYEVQSYVLPAASVGAPHKRDRVWVVAFKNTERNGFIQRKPEQEGTEIWEQRNTCTGNSIGFCGEKVAGVTTDTDNDGRIATKIGQGLGEGNDRNKTGENNSVKLEGRAFSDGVTTDAESGGNGRLRNEGETTGTRESSIPFGSVCGIPNWDNFPTTEPTIHTGNDGLSSQLDGITFSKWRNESIKAAGNAIVPQVVYQIFKAINEYENLHTNRNNTRPPGD